jgi:hypothetical protein
MIPHRGRCRAVGCGGIGQSDWFISFSAANRGLAVSAARRAQIFQHTDLADASPRFRLCSELLNGERPLQRLVSRVRHLFVAGQETWLPLKAPVTPDVLWRVHRRERGASHLGEPPQSATEFANSQGC